MITTYYRRLLAYARAETAADFGRNAIARSARVLAPMLTAALSLFLSDSLELWPRLGVVVGAAAGGFVASVAIVFLSELVRAPAAMDAELRAQIPSPPAPPRIDVEARVDDAWIQSATEKWSLAYLRVSVHDEAAVDIRAHLNFWTADGVALLDGRSLAAKWSDRTGRERITIEDGTSADLRLVAKSFRDMHPFALDVSAGQDDAIRGRNRSLPVDPSTIHVHVRLRAQGYDRTFVFIVSHEKGNSGLTIAMANTTSIAE